MNVKFKYIKYKLNMILNIIYDINKYKCGYIYIYILQNTVMITKLIITKCYMIKYRYYSIYTYIYTCVYIYI